MHFNLVFSFFLGCVHSCFLASPKMEGVESSEHRSLKWKKRLASLPVFLLSSHHAAAQHNAHQTPTHTHIP